jgi:hypothetical protein
MPDQEGNVLRSVAQRRRRDPAEEPRESRCVEVTIVMARQPEPVVAKNPSRPLVRLSSSDDGALRPLECGSELPSKEEVLEEAVASATRVDAGEDAENKGFGSAHRRTQQ